MLLSKQHSHTWQQAAQSTTTLTGCWHHSRLPRTALYNSFMSGAAHNRHTEHQTTSAPDTPRATHAPGPITQLPSTLSLLVFQPLPVHSTLGLPARPAVHVPLQRVLTRVNSQPVHVALTPGTVTLVLQAGEGVGRVGGRQQET